MDFSNFNWAYFSLALDGAVWLAWLIVAMRNRPGLRALAVSFAHLAIASLMIAAPLRGYVDPHYPGYSFGFLHSAGGLNVTLIAGGVIAAALASAFLTVRNRPGPAMWWVALTSAFFTLNVGGSWLESTVTNIADNEIQLGEYVHIPGAIATGIMFVLFVCPFLLGIEWAPRRTRLTAA